MTESSDPTPRGSAARPTLDDLVALCERGVVPHEQWHDRDTAGAQRQLGAALALLRAGCNWRLANSPEQTPDTTPSSTATTT